jgi:hypothetical protein
MTATLSYVEHLKDIRSKAKQIMQSKFFRCLDSTDLQTCTSLGTLFSSLEAHADLKKQEGT